MLVWDASFDMVLYPGLKVRTMFRAKVGVDNVIKFDHILDCFSVTRFAGDEVEGVSDGEVVGHVGPFLAIVEWSDVSAK